MQKKSLAFRFIIFFLLAITCRLFAGHELGNVRASYPNLSIGTPITVIDNKFGNFLFANPVGIKDPVVKTRISIGIDEANTNVITPFDYQVVVNVSNYKFIGGALVTNNSIQTLTVSYNPNQANVNEKDLAVIEIDGGYLAAATIVSVTDNSTNNPVSVLPQNIFMELEIDAERYYPMDFNNQPYTSSQVKTNFIPPATTTSPIQNEVEIHWPYIFGAEEYDLEWVWVSKDVITPNYKYEIDFKNNSTRIRTSNNKYTITNIFEEGWVFFRIRGVSSIDNAGDDKFSNVYFTPWTFADHSTFTNAGSYPGTALNTYYFFVPKDHEKEKNWQYKSTYAEEGKKKEVISYFDGTLRNRQSVTKSNTDENTIVAETYYDYQGRAAVQSLPVPTDFKDIQFHQYSVVNSGGTNKLGFNFVLSSKQPFDRESFDKDPASGSCDAGGLGMEPNLTTTVGSTLKGLGTSYYYSSYNLDKTFEQGYVPDAENFPYTQTEYTPDNTGRISRQGGVGLNHQLGSKHETKYFYGRPATQQELDRLFGSEVGDFKHYKKNMVIDANGQISITYLDQEGRTIATALAGDNPLNTKIMASNTGTVEAGGDLLNKDNISDVDDDQDSNILSEGGKELTFSSELLADSKGFYEFNYDMTGTAFTYDCTAGNICYDCVYDLEINIVDKCGANPPGFSPIKEIVGNILPSQIIHPTQTTNSVTVDGSCELTVQFIAPPNALKVYLEAGAYTVYKKLSINEQAMADYLKNYIENNPCIKTEQNFIDEQTANIDYSGCDMTCDQCVQELGTEADFIAKGGTHELFIQAIKDCREPCEYKTSCEAAEIAMLADMSPGGQYADWEEGNNCNPGIYPLSILNESNALPEWVSSFIPSWKNPKTITNQAHYYEVDGSVAKVTIVKMGTGLFTPPVNSTVMGNHSSDPDGTVFDVEPQELADACTFKSRWKNSWAKSLIVYHPEFPYYEYCLKNEADNQTGSNYTVGYESTPGNVINGPINTSSHYDSVLVEIEDLTLVTSSDLQKVVDPIGLFSGSVSDPYFLEGAADYWYKTPKTANAGYTAVGQLAGSSFVGNMFYPKVYHNATKRFRNYLGSPLNLYEFAYAIVKGCATQYGTTITNASSCFNGLGTPSSSGYDYSIMLPSSNVTPQESREIWEKYKFMYLSLKQKLQNEAAQSYATNYIPNSVILNHSSPFDSYNQCNECIGNPNSSMHSTPFATWDFGFGIGSITSWLRNWFFLPIQTTSSNHFAPCGQFAKDLYASKVKRFPSMADVEGQTSGSNPDAILYQSTGKCPVAIDLEALIKGLATNNQITTNQNLQTITSFTQRLYDFIYTTANGNPPASYSPLNWTPSISGNMLTAAIGPNVGTCGVTLSFPNNGEGIDWSNMFSTGNYVTNVYDIKFINYNAATGTSNFSIMFDVYINGTIKPYFVSGTICGNIGSCTFPPVCHANSTAIAFKNLFNQLANEQAICTSPSLPANLTAAPFNTTFNTIAQTLPAGLPWAWAYLGTASGLVYDASGNNPYKIRLTTNSSTDFNLLCGNSTYNVSVNSIVPDGSGTPGNCIISYSHIDPVNNTTPPDYGITSGQIYANISYSSDNITFTGYNLGDCEQQEQLICNTNEHKVKKDLEKFFTQNNFSSLLNSSSAVQLTSSTGFSELLQQQVAGVTNLGASGSINSPNYYWIRTAPLAGSTYTTLNASICTTTNSSAPSTNSTCCSVSLSFSNTTTAHTINDIVSLTNFAALTYPTIGGLQYSFSVTATCSDGTNEIMVGNTSCFAIRNCEEICDNLTNPIICIQRGIIVEKSSHIFDAYYPEYGTSGSPQQFPPCTASSTNFCADLLFGTHIINVKYDYAQAGNVFGDIKLASVQPNLSPGVNYTAKLKLDINSINTSQIQAAIFKNGTQVGPAQNFAVSNGSTVSLNFPVTFSSASDVLTYKLLSPSTSYSADINYHINLIYCYDQSNPTDSTNSGGVTSHTWVMEDFELSPPQFYNNGFTSSSQTAPGCSPPGPSGTFVNNASLIYNSQYTHSSSCAFNSNPSQLIAGFDHNSCFTSTADCYNSFIVFENMPTSRAFANFACPIQISFNYSLKLPSAVDFELYLNNILVSTKTVSSNFPAWNQIVFDLISYSPSYLTAAGYMPVKIVAHASNNSNMNAFQYGIDNVTLQVIGCNPNSPPCTSTLPQNPFPEIPYENPCFEAAYNDALSEGLQNYTNYIDSLKDGFIEQYIKKCIGGAIENFTLKYGSNQYHYTLYYYDQAGNLVQTVPPQGVSVITNAADLLTVKNDRANKVYPKTFYTSHSMGTTYTYNSLNQLVKQYTPDAGESNFWYDKLGRLVASQNAKQLAKSSASQSYYSYTIYDALGRISQVGEMNIGTNLASQTFATLWTVINDPLYPTNLTVNNLAEVTKTYYGDDLNYYSGLSAVPSPQFNGINQAFSRGRVVATTIEDVDDNDNLTYNHATYYSYDVHGNVKELLQHNPLLASFNHDFKLVNYNYDLVSGKVNSVAYQPGKYDQFYHQYEYDADNRITNVWTSNNNVIWNQDAKYFYYLHGPLARVEMGNNKVQGLDYAYTIQGWIKGVNSNILSEANDIGKDGNINAGLTNFNTMHRHVARDGFGYSLNYFSSNTGTGVIDDYKPINLSGTAPIITAQTHFVAAVGSIGSPALYNGNINHMVTTYLNVDPLATNLNTGALVGINQPFAQLNTYKYDQLNRISETQSYKNIDYNTNSWNSSSDSKYAESFSYDANGNIQKLSRNGNTAAMDNLTYHYYTQSGGIYVANPNGTAAQADATNKLSYVSDSEPSSNYGDDIDNQALNNYDYDAIGNLIKDDAEGITNVEWTVYGKIKTITKSSGMIITFNYDASGNRISKKVAISPVQRGGPNTTYYVRDAQGNVMATYEQHGDELDIPQLYLDEQYVYGSSRLGLVTNNIKLTPIAPILSTTLFTRTLGLKSYELSNHLGNVLTVVSDRKIAVDNNNDNIVDYFLPDIVSSTDYYSFGAPMPGRQFNSNSMKYTFNGKEFDQETSYLDYGERMYHAALGKFISVDPLDKNYPFLTPYQYASNNPIRYIDLDGAEARETATPSSGAKLAQDNTAPFINIQYKLAVATKANQPKPMPQFKAITAEDARRINANRAYQAQEKYFEGMSDFNRVMITSPVIQETAKSMLIVGTMGAVGGVIPVASSRLSSAYSFLGRHSKPIGDFMLNGSINAGANIIGQAAFNGGFHNVDYADAGIAFALHKPTFSNALVGGGLAAGIDLKPQGDPFFFGLGGGSKSTAQIGVDFTANFGLNLLNNKIGISLGQEKVSGGSFFVGSGLPFMGNVLTGGGQTIMGNLLFPPEKVKELLNQPKKK